ncbi:MAG: nuclear transport factor 2 family protein [Chthoniobacterales bacterium]
MKKTVISMLMVLGFATAGFGAGAEAELKTLEQQWLDAYAKGDTAFLKTVEADGWTLVDSDGTIATKDKDIKELGDKTFVCKSASMSDAKVNMMGENFAYVTGIVKMAGSYKGKEFDESFRAVDVFEKKNGKWQSTYSQITKIGKEKE